MVALWIVFSCKVTLCRLVHSYGYQRFAETCRLHLWGTTIVPALYYAGDGGGQLLLNVGKVKQSRYRPGVAQTVPGS